MKNVSIVFISVLLISSLLFARKQEQNEQQKQYQPGVVIVKLKSHNNSLQTIDAVSSVNQMQSMYRIDAPQQLFTNLTSKKKMIGVEELERVYTFRVQIPTDVEALAKKIALNPMVEYAQPDYLMYADFVPNDPLYGQVYPLGIVKAEQAWDIQKGDSTVVIAIIDTGVDWDHPDLAASIWNNKNEISGNGIDDDGNGFVDDTRGWDFVNVSGVGVYPGEDSLQEDNNPMDFNGHGTHCAGIAAGISNNGVGIASLGSGCKIMPIRIGWHTAAGLGTGYTSSMAKAFVYAANNGASVASLSFGTDAVAAEGAKYAYRNGVVVCNSAGNSNTDVAGAVGALPEALSVAATNSADNKASYSSFNKAVDISAPGGDFSSGNLHGFLSTVPTPSTLYASPYEEFQGTSMAGPFVASLAGLIKSKNKSWTPAQIMFQITGTADNIEASLAAANKGKMGYGRINALRALSETPAAASPKLVFIDYKVNDATGGNGNGILEPGENAKINVIVRNDWGDAQNLTATLATSHWTTNVTKSSSNYGLLYGISKIDSSKRGSYNDEFGISISADAIPQVIPFTVTFTATGGYSQQFSFNIALGSRLLLVDDDDGTVNVENYYSSALTSLGTVYDVWDHAKQGTPSASILQNYQAVIWSCEWAFPSLDSSDRSSISSYLDGGGKFFLSGQDIGWDLADPTGNEYIESAGASKTFFEKYLRSKYLGDDAAFNGLTGVINDSIGSDLTISRNQKERSSTQQFPDVIDTLGGSTFSFKYSGGGFNGKGGAILYNKNYKLAFFSFGGFESITDSVKRITVMERMLKWMFEYNLSVDKLANSESTSPFPVSATITSSSPILDASLYWDTDGSLPFNKVAMTLSSGKYSAAIPAQTITKEMQYFVLAKSTKGFLPFLISKFNVGPDIILPIVTVTDTIQNSIKVQGPYIFSLQATDNLGIDTSSAVIKYSVNNGAEQSVSFQKVASNKYTATIIPGSKLSSGDVITYYATINDIAVGKNTARYPLTGKKQFIIGKEIVDDFENPVSGKWNLGLWGYTTQFKNAGKYSLADSPDSVYKPNQARTAVLNTGYDLTPFTSAVLRLYRRNAIDPTDTLFIEISNNDVQWTILKKVTNNSFTFTKEEFALPSFVGAGNANVKVRFRFITSPSAEKDGAYIDDIEILTNQLTVGVNEETVLLPNEFSLKQNYPNPFNPTTTIQYTVPFTSKVFLKVYDVIGKEIATLVNSEHQPGFYQVQFDASKLSSGMYYYRISSGSFTDIKKMLLIK